MMHRIYRDGDIATFELVEKESNRGRRFDVPWTEKDYYIVEPGEEGRLRLYTPSGLFEISRRVDSTPSVTPTSTAVLLAPTPTRTPDVPDEYAVKAGDTLRSIAQRFGTSVDALIEANDIEDPNLIRTGAILRIPPDATGGPVTPPSSATETAGPATCPTTAEAAYLRNLRDGVSGIDEAMADLARLFVRLENDPGLVFTAGFASDFEAIATAVEREAQEILDLNPPRSALPSGFHAGALALARATTASMEHFANSFAREDIGEFELGTFQLENVEFLLPAVLDGIEGFCE